jgi:hypothetical protein
MSTNTRISNSSEEGLDRLIAAYFRAEMPANWPAAPQPWAEKPHVSVNNHANPARRSRWALAASVALLVGGCWYLSGHLSDGQAKKSTNFEGTTAKMPKEIKDNLGTPKGKTP